MGEIRVDWNFEPPKSSGQSITLVDESTTFSGYVIDSRQARRLPRRYL